MINICCTNQGEVGLIWDCEDDPSVFALEEIAFVVIIKFARHDVTAAHQSHTLAGVDSNCFADDVLNPRATCIDQKPGAHNPAFLTLSVFERNVPNAIYLIGCYDFGAHVDARTAGLCIAGI